MRTPLSQSDVVTHMGEGHVGLSWSQLTMPPTVRERSFSVLNFRGSPVFMPNAERQNSAW